MTSPRDTEKTSPRDTEKTSPKDTELEGQDDPRISEDRGLKDNLEDLLPWYLNGSLSDEEKNRVEKGLRKSETLRRLLEETADALELAAPRPSAEDLVAHACGELGDDEERAVLGHLRDAPEDAELVRLARTALRPEPEAAEPPSTAKQPVVQFPARVSSLTRWKGLAAAASLLAAISLWGWLDQVRERTASSAGVGPGVQSVQVLELLPDESVVRGGPTAGAELGQATAPLALVLVTEPSVQPQGLVVVSVRDRSDHEIARLENQQLAADGTITILLDPALVSAAESLVVIGRTSEQQEPQTLLSYRLRSRR